MLRNALSCLPLLIFNQTPAIIAVPLGVVKEPHPFFFKCLYYYYRRFAKNVSYFFLQLAANSAHQPFFQMLLLIVIGVSPKMFPCISVAKLFQLPCPPYTTPIARAKVLDGGFLFLLPFQLCLASSPGEGKGSRRLPRSNSTLSCSHMTRAGKSPHRRFASQPLNLSPLTLSGCSSARPSLPPQSRYLFPLHCIAIGHSPAAFAGSDPVSNQLAHSTPPFYAHTA